ncbi:g4386 [Coccomyxa elongata]
MASTSTQASDGKADGSATGVKPSEAQAGDPTKSCAGEASCSSSKEDPADEIAHIPLSESDQKRLEHAEQLKQEGNKLYAENDTEGAVAKYEEALQTAPGASTKQRAVYHANLAACHLKCKQFEDAVQDSTAALELDPSYVKALMRRSAAYEELDDLEHALSDSQKVKELDPENALANKTVLRLTPIVNERREKIKDEMLGKLKDLGNTVLGKFGLSLDNFKAEKDPNTGSYSINFKQ